MSASNGKITRCWTIYQIENAQSTDIHASFVRIILATKHIQHFRKVFLQIYGRPPKSQPSAIKQNTSVELQNNNYFHPHRNNQQRELLLFYLFVFLALIKYARSFFHSAVSSSICPADLNEVSFMIGFFMSHYGVWCSMYREPHPNFI